MLALQGSRVVVTAGARGSRWVAERHTPRRPRHCDCGTDAAQNEAGIEIGGLGSDIARRSGAVGYSGQNGDQMRKMR